MSAPYAAWFAAFASLPAATRAGGDVFRNNATWDASPAAARERAFACSFDRSPLEVVAVTYTEKAAAELRARIRREVARHRPDDLEAAGC